MFHTNDWSQCMLGGHMWLRKWQMVLLLHKKPESYKTFKNLYGLSCWISVSFGKQNSLPIFHNMCSRNTRRCKYGSYIMKTKLNLNCLQPKNERTRTATGLLLHHWQECVHNLAIEVLVMLCGTPVAIFPLLFAPIRYQLKWRPPVLGIMKEEHSK